MNSVSFDTRSTQVQLSDGSVDTSASGTLVGWGSTDVDCNDYGTVLREAVVDIETDCPQEEGAKAFDAKTQVCAGRKDGQKCGCRAETRIRSATSKPRPVSAEAPRRSRGVAATRLRGISAS